MTLLFCRILLFWVFVVNCTRPMKIRGKFTKSVENPLIIRWKSVDNPLKIRWKWESVKDRRVYVNFWFFPYLVTLFFPWYYISHLIYAEEVENLEFQIPKIAKSYFFSLRWMRADVLTFEGEKLAFHPSRVSILYSFF